MTDGAPRTAVEEYLGGRSGEEDGYPVTPSAVEASCLQHFEEKGPRHRVKGLRYIKLEQQFGDFPLAKKHSRPLHILVVVKYGTPLDEGTLVFPHKLLQARRQPVRQQLGHQLRKAVDQGDGPVVPCFHRRWGFGQR